MSSEQTPGNAHIRMRNEALTRIHAAAREVMRGKEFGAVRRQDIAARAGIGSGTLYHYYPTKRILVLAVYAPELATITDDARQALVRHAPAEVLTCFVTDLVAVVAEHRALPGALTVPREDDGRPDAGVTFDQIVEVLATVLRAHHGFVGRDEASSSRDLAEYHLRAMLSWLQAHPRSDVHIARLMLGRLL